MPKQDENAFGNRLAELRGVAGLTQVQLAKKAGLTQAGIAQFETGRRKPSWESVQALAAALGVKCGAFETAAAQAKPAKRNK